MKYSPKIIRLYISAFHRFVGFLFNDLAVIGIGMLCAMVDLIFLTKPMNVFMAVFYVISAGVGSFLSLNLWGCCKNYFYPSHVPSKFCAEIS